MRAEWKSDYEQETSFGGRVLIAIRFFTCPTPKGCFESGCAVCRARMINQLFEEELKKRQLQK